jgi:hypothetical protein
VCWDLYSTNKSEVPQSCDERKYTSWGPNAMPATQKVCFQTTVQMYVIKLEAELYLSCIYCTPLNKSCVTGPVTGLLYLLFCLRGAEMQRVWEKRKVTSDTVAEGGPLTAHCKSDRGYYPHITVRLIETMWRSISHWFWSFLPWRVVGTGVVLKEFYSFSVILLRARHLSYSASISRVTPPSQKFRRTYLPQFICMQI